MSKKAMALLRVSTNTQDVERQRADIQKLKKWYDLDIVGTLELVGVSGTATLTNVQVQQVLREAQQPGVDGLAISAVDRLARPKKGAHYAIVDGLADARRTLWTVREGALKLWTGAGHERCMAALQRAGSEWREIRRRTINGKWEKREMGRNVNGSVVLPDGLGYQRITDAAGRTIDGRWFYVEPEISRVRQAYQLLFEDRYQLAEIERQVGWGRGRIRTLANPVWKGLRIYPPPVDDDDDDDDKPEKVPQPLKVQLPLEPVLTPEQWALAQTLLAKRRTWSKETRDQRFLGAGLLVCACGKPYYVQCDTRRGSHDRYYCASLHGGPRCGASQLRRLVVDAVIERLVAEHLTDAAFLAKVFARVKQPPVPDIHARERQLAELAARRQKWIDEYDEDRITKEEFHRKMEAVTKATRAVEASIPVVTPPPVLDVRAVVTGLVEWALQFPHITDFLTKRSELKRVVRRIPVIGGHVPSFDLSGAFLGEFRHMKSAQPSRSPYWRRCRAPE
jgi:DNA invertase Pin-like site-specific DNA recombinase